MFEIIRILSCTEEMGQMGEIRRIKYYDQQILFESMIFSCGYFFWYSFQLQSTSTQRVASERDRLHLLQLQFAVEQVHVRSGQCGTSLRRHVLVHLWNSLALQHGHANGSAS
jgi:hypothetical protein